VDEKAILWTTLATSPSTAVRRVLTGQSIRLFAGDAGGRLLGACGFVTAKENSYEDVKPLKAVLKENLQTRKQVAVQVCAK